MRVVTASVHEPRRAGGIGHVVGLLDLQGVHVGAQADSRPALAQVTDDARLAPPVSTRRPIPRRALDTSRAVSCSWKPSSGCR